MNPLNWKNIRRKAAAILAACGLTITGAAAITSVESPGNLLTDAAFTDSLNFNNGYKAQPLPVVLESQWAYAVEGMNGTTTLNSPFSSTRQPRLQGGGACVWGGGSGGNCAGATRADASTNGNIEKLDWTPSGFLKASSYVNPQEPITTSVRCNNNGTLFAAQPGGRIQYGNSSYALNNGWQYKSINEIGNGQTFTARQKSARTADTYTAISITPSWGTDTVNKRAWSQVTIQYRGEYQTPPSQNSGWKTYIARSECGLRYNNGVGTTGPRTVTTFMAQSFTDPLMQLFQQFGTEGTADPAADPTAEDTSTSATNPAESTTDPATETTNPTDNEDPSADITGGNSPDDSADPAANPESQENSEGAETGAEESTEEGAVAGKTGTDAEASTEDNEGVDAEGANEETETETPAPDDTGAADAPEAQPDPGTAPGSPRTSGFIAEGSRTFQGQPYQTLSTRELNALDQITLEAVQEEATRAVEQHTYTGQTSGAAWKYFSAEATGQATPILEITLLDGSTVQIRPRLPQVKLPTPDIIPAPQLSPAKPTPTPTKPATKQPAPAAPAEPAHSESTTDTEEAAEPAHTPAPSGTPSAGGTGTTPAAPAPTTDIAITAPASAPVISTPAVPALAPAVPLQPAAAQ